MPQALKRKPNLVAIFPPGQFGICTHLGTFKCKKKKRMKERRQKGREMQGKTVTLFLDRERDVVQGKPPNVVFIWDYSFRADAHLYEINSSRIKLVEMVLPIRLIF